jgi:hypothetical protein
VVRARYRPIKYYNIYTYMPPTNGGFFLLQIVHVWILKPTKPYRLLFSERHWLLVLSVARCRKMEIHRPCKKNDAHDFVVKNVLAEGKASPTLREFAESTFDATLTAENLETLICMCAALDLLIFADLQALVCQHSMTLL